MEGSRCPLWLPLFPSPSLSLPHPLIWELVQWDEKLHFFKAQLLKLSAICSLSVPMWKCVQAATVFVEIYGGSAVCAEALPGQMLAGPASRELAPPGLIGWPDSGWLLGRVQWGRGQGSRWAPSGLPPFRWIWGRSAHRAWCWSWETVALRCWFTSPSSRVGVGCLTAAPFYKLPVTLCPLVVLCLGTLSATLGPWLSLSPLCAEL